MDFLNDRTKPIYFKYLSAAFGSAMITSIYSIVDMAMVGQYQGPDGTAALAVVAPVWNVIYSLGLLMGIGGYFIRLVSPQDNWIWLLGIIHIEPAHYLQYIMMFVLGIISYRYQWFDRIKNSTGLCALVIGIALMIGNLLRDNGPWNDFVTEWFGIYESLFCVFFCFGLLWFIGKYANHTNHFLNWCAQQSYGAYVIHLFVLLGIQYATDQVQAVGIIKFLFIGTLTTILSFYLTSLIRKIPGVKRVI